MAIASDNYNTAAFMEALHYFNILLFGRLYLAEV